MDEKDYQKIADNQDLLQLEYMRGFDGDTLDRAKNAMLCALSDFYPSQRSVLLMFLTKMEKAKEMVRIEMETMGATIDQHLQSQITGEFQAARRILEEQESEDAGTTSTKS